MNISAILTTDEGLKICVFPQEDMILDLIKAIKEKGTEDVVLTDGSYLVDGIYVPGKGNKSTIMVLPMKEDE